MGPVSMSPASPQRRIFIGDIQGCHDELLRLLEILDVQPGRDEVHPVGDLINRGPDSAGVLRTLRDLDAGGVLGNHDLHAIRVAAGSRRPGRRDTLDDLLSAQDSTELIGWLAARPLIRTWPDIVCIHAGIHPLWEDPETALAGIPHHETHPSSDFATRVRTCDPSGQRPPKDWPPPDPPYRPWHHYWLERAGESRTVVFGHWASQGLLVGERLRGLDTGCVWGKQLTAWIAEEDRLVSVPAARVYSISSLPTIPHTEGPPTQG